MKKVFLHGRLGARFGKEFYLDISTPAEAVRALGVQLPGFVEAIKEGSWHIVRGPLSGKDAASEDDLLLNLGRQEELHILPAVQGANNGAMMAVLGVLLIVIAIFVPMAAPLALMVGAAGVGMAVGGLITMTTNMVGADVSKSGQDARASYLFNGPVNQSTQGVAVPRGYGRALVGSIVVSGGLFAEEVAV